MYGKRVYSFDPSVQEAHRSFKFSKSATQALHQGVLKVLYDFCNLQLRIRTYILLKQRTIEFVVTVMAAISLYNDRTKGLATRLLK